LYASSSLIGSHFLFRNFCPCLSIGVHLRHVTTHFPFLNTLNCQIPILNHAVPLHMSPTCTKHSFCNTELLCLIGQPVFEC
jgi:hypothetical protein